MYSETPGGHFTTYEKSARKCKAIAQRNAIKNEIAYQKKRAATARRDRKRLANPPEYKPQPKFTDELRSFTVGVRRIDLIAGHWSHEC